MPKILAQGSRITRLVLCNFVAPLKGAQVGRRYIITCHSPLNNASLVACIPLPTQLLSLLVGTPHKRSDYLVRFVIPRLVAFFVALNPLLIFCSLAPVPCN